MFGPYFIDPSQLVTELLPTKKKEDLHKFQKYSILIKIESILLKKKRNYCTYHSGDIFLKEKNYYINQYYIINMRLYILLE